VTPEQTKLDTPDTLGENHMTGKKGGRAVNLFWKEELGTQLVCKTGKTDWKGGKKFGKKKNGVQS